MQCVNGPLPELTIREQVDVEAGGEDQQGGAPGDAAREPLPGLRLIGSLEEDSREEKDRGPREQAQGDAPVEIRREAERVGGEFEATLDRAVPNEGSGQRGGDEVRGEVARGEEAPAGSGSNAFDQTALT